jgi:hypothetical protein
MITTRTRLASLTVLAGASLLGCQTANDTRVTVMNETDGPVLVNVMRASADAMLVEDTEVRPSGVELFAVPNEAELAVQVGIRPLEFRGAPAQWIEFPQGGPYLLRVQGSATDLRFVPSLDGAGDLEAGEIQPVYTNRRFNEPPVTPSR